MKRHAHITIKYYPAAILLLLLLSGCQKSMVNNQSQHILFQYEYLDDLNGVHQGFYIDDEGAVFVYNNPDEWNFHLDDYNFSISEEQIAENLSKCVKSELYIETDKLAKFSGHITKIISSKITATKKGNRETGKTVFICYDYSESTEMYKGGLIKMEGSYSCENLNFFSKRISAWLKEVNNSISNNN